METPNESPERIRKMCQDMADRLAAIHGVDVAATGLDFLGDGRDHLDLEIDHWAQEMHRVQKGTLPALERLLQELRDTKPSPSPTITLVHGDAKPGNFAFVDDHVSAVFDWEMTTIGDPLVDIGWMELMWMQPVGLTSHPAASTIEEFLDRYQAASGVTPQNRLWYPAPLQDDGHLLIGGMLFDDGLWASPSRLRPVRWRYAKNGSSRRRPRNPQRTDGLLRSYSDTGMIRCANGCRAPRDTHGEAELRQEVLGIVTAHQVVRHRHPHRSRCRVRATRASSESLQSFPHHRHHPGQPRNDLRRFDVDHAEPRIGALIFDDDPQGGVQSRVGGQPRNGFGHRTHVERTLPHHERFEKFLLRAEPAVERRSGDTSLQCDLREAELRHAAASQDFRSRDEYPLAG
jgi:hypothetical protein